MHVSVYLYTWEGGKERTSEREIDRERVSKEGGSERGREGEKGGKGEREREGGRGTGDREGREGGRGKGEKVGE